MVPDKNFESKLGTSVGLNKNVTNWLFEKNVLIRLVSKFYKLAESKAIFLFYIVKFSVRNSKHFEILNLGWTVTDSRGNPERRNS